jgi:hypothetical protein
LQLHWPEEAAEYSGSVRVESSDDLGAWRLIRNDVPVINLRTGGLRLVQNRLEFPSTKAKFWRVTWSPKTAPFELTGVSAYPTVDRPNPPKLTLISTGTHVGKQEGEIAFDFGAKLPVTQVNVALPEPNSAVKIELLSRDSATDAWHAVTEGEFFRVRGGSSEHRNAAIPIPINFDRYWLARRVQPTGPIGDVKLEAAWDVRILVFLAQGSGPFVLAYGNSSAGPASVSLDPLLKDVTVSPALAGSPHTLGGPDRLRPPAKTVPWKMAALWAALGLGVVLLAWMAYHLSREMGTSAAERE